jgi:hypothetical protein
VVCIIRRDARKENTAIFCTCSGIPVEPFPEPIATSLPSLLHLLHPPHDAAHVTSEESTLGVAPEVEKDIAEGVQEIGVSMIVITEGKGVDHERGGVPTAVKADIIHDLPAGDERGGRERDRAVRVRWMMSETLPSSLTD